jgi:hypothetical protein
LLSLWHHPPAGDLRPLAGDAAVARLWLMAFAHDEAWLAEMRGLLLKEGCAGALSGVDRDGLLDRLAAAIAGGALDIWDARETPSLFRLVRQSAPAPGAAPAASPSPARPAAAAPPSASDTTFDSDLDGAAMASTLRQAANDGVPFCEVCAREAAAA